MRRRFRVARGAIEDTLSDPELITVGVHVDQGERIVLIEHCAGRPDGGRIVGGCGFKYDYRGGEAPTVTAMSEPMARALVMHAPRTISMHRFKVHGAKGIVWSINAFTGKNEGLVLVEGDLPQKYVVPRWFAAATEVTGRSEYEYYALANHPFTEWTRR